MIKINKPQYERIGTLEIEKVFPFIEKNLKEYEKTRVTIDGFTVKINSVRLKSFFLHGTACSCCENKASFFAVERNTGTTSGYHLNLYGIDKDGAEILFTHDHILARSLGGKDSVDNTRTACGPCNWKKGYIESLLMKCSDNEEKKMLFEQLKQFLPLSNPGVEIDQIRDNLDNKKITKPKV